MSNSATAALRSRFPQLGRALAGLLAVCVALPDLWAQEQLAVDFAGNAFAVSGAARTLGPTGVTGCNAMAVQAGVYYVSARSGTRHQLAVLDPFTAQATVLFPDLGVDLRALADSSNPNELFGIANAAPDRLVRINLTTGLVTTVGSTGRTGLQALARIGTQLWGWDVDAGLLAVSPLSGASFDPFPFQGNQGADIQFLNTTSNQLRGGNHRLYSINPANGVATAFPTELSIDMRGAEPRRGVVESFGTGCSTNGFGTVLTATGTGLAGTSLFFISNDHTPNAPAQLFVAADLATTTVSPLSCPLLVDTSVFVAVTLSNQGKLNLSLPLPPVFGVDHFFQLLVLESSFQRTITNAVHVRVPH